MLAPDTELYAAMESMMEQEIRRLLGEADSCVFVLYDPTNPKMEPHDYVCRERQGTNPILMDVSLKFEGIAVWYMIFREEENYKAKKILLQIENGQFKHGQMGDFTGLWDDFPQYIMEDRTVQAQLLKSADNQTHELSADDQILESQKNTDTLNSNDQVEKKSENVEPVHWYEPPEEVEEKSEVSLFVLDDIESRDLDEIFQEGDVAVDDFPSRPFSRFGD